MKTLNDIIYNNASFDLRDLALFATDAYGITTPQTTQFDRYFPYIDDYINTFRVNYAQRERYKYRPDLLSLDVYGSPLFDWGVMKMNDAESYSRFELFSRVKLIEPDILTNVIISLKAKDTELMLENRIENGIF